jgi:hypothetical protein
MQRSGLLNNLVCPLHALKRFFPEKNIVWFKFTVNRPKTLAAGWPQQSF